MRMKGYQSTNMVGSPRAQAIAVVVIGLVAASALALYSVYLGRPSNATHLPALSICQRARKKSGH